MTSVANHEDAPYPSRTRGHRPRYARHPIRVADVSRPTHTVCGPVVYGLGFLAFNQKERVRVPFGLPPSVRSYMGYYGRLSPRRNGFESRTHRQFRASDYVERNHLQVGRLHRSPWASRSRLSHTGRNPVGLRLGAHPTPHDLQQDRRPAAEAPRSLLTLVSHNKQQGAHHGPQSKTRRPYGGSDERATARYRRCEIAVLGRRSLGVEAS